MTHKEKRPPAATGEALQKNNSHPFSSAIHPEIQALRTLHRAPLRARAGNGRGRREDPLRRGGAMNRRRLPNRRRHEVIDFSFRGYAYALGIGRFSDGSLAEVFIDCAKGSTPVAADARDAAVCLSLALQYGVPPDAIRSAVTRESDGSASGIVGAVLDLLAEERQ